MAINDATLQDVIPDRLNDITLNYQNGADLFQIRLL